MAPAAAPHPPEWDAAVRSALLRLAAAAPGRRIAFAECDPARALLVRRWAVPAAGGNSEAAALDMEAARLHPLLADDAGGERPFRGVSGTPPWALGDLLPEIDVAAAQVQVRAVACDGRWLGVLVVAEPRRWLGRADDISTAADVLELELGCARLRETVCVLDSGHREALDAQSQRWAERVRTLEGQLAEERRVAVRTAPRLQALDGAAGHATEMLMQAHEELARQAERGRRQARVLFLLRRLLEGQAEGVPAAELAAECVRRVSEAFGGGRCSLLLVEPAAGPEGELRLAAALGLPAGIDPAAVRVPLGRGISGEVARSGREIVVRDEEEAALLPLGGDAAYRGSSFVSFPLRSAGRVLGVLNLTNFRAGTCDDAELELLRLVALSVGMIVDRARLAARLFGGGTPV